MGKKKSKTNVSEDVTVETKIVKLSYLQTIAVAQSIGDISDIETKASSGPVGLDVNTSKKGGFLNLSNTLFGKRKINISVEQESTGEKIIDNWMHPYFDKIRYAIGIKEITASAYTFAEASEFVSTPFGSPKDIIKVYCITDEYIPPDFDQSISWVSYYIKPEGEADWIRLNSFAAPTKFDDNGSIIPKIINFNIPKAPNAPLEDKFQFTDSPVRQIRFKAVLNRPSDSTNQSTTPLLKSYRLVLTPKELL